MARQKNMTFFSRNPLAAWHKVPASPLPGVPSGQVLKVELWEKDPDFVRVRIAVSEETPILQGTTATIQSISFTAPPNIQLDGAVKDAPPITELGPEGAPVIPTKPGALGEILNSAPLVVERLGNAH